MSAEMPSSSAWERNWGFVPITEEEVRSQASDLKPVLDEDWCFIAERDGEVLGAAVTLPDVNQVLAKMNGSLLPFGWLTFLRAMYDKHGVNTEKAGIDRVRVFALGVKPEHQHHGMGRRVMMPGMAVADAEGVGIHLETTNPANLDFYRSLGFDVSHHLRLEPGGPELWAMWKVPR